MRPVNPLSTSYSLLRHATRREDVAWSALVQMYSPMVHQWCRQHRIATSDAEDIAQEVFVAVSRNLHRFSEPRSNHHFRGWLWTVVRSKIHDHQRQQRKNPRPGLPEYMSLDVLDGLSVPNEETGTSPSHTLTTHRMRDALQQIRRDFSEQSWTAFWRTTALGEPPSQVAKELGMTASAVCMCRSRILRRLRETMQVPVRLSNA